jgi:hypothetical protein
MRLKRGKNKEIAHNTEVLIVPMFAVTFTSLSVSALPLAIRCSN